MRLAESRGIRFNAQAVVDGVPELLLAPEVAPGRLNRNVPEEELDLVKFAVIPLPQTWPNLVMARNTVPSVMLAAAVHASIASLTHAGMGTVRTCPPMPTRSAMTQCSSRC